MPEITYRLESNNTSGSGVYAVSVVATRGNVTAHLAEVVAADSEEEARGLALQIGKEEWPTTDGWTGHHVACRAFTVDSTGEVVIHGSQVM